MAGRAGEQQDGVMTETSSSIPPPAPYGDQHANGSPRAPGGAAFFDWIRGLGFVRGQDRWLAGVCGAVAARTGLDAMVVRGIAIVIAILGGPIFFLYAVGWALMPDASGRSLVEKAARQVFEPAMIAVGALLFLTFVPWMQGIWWQGPPEVWGMPGWLEVLLRTSWAIGLTAAIIVLVIYIAKRVPSPRTQPSRGYGSATAQPGTAQSGAAQSGTAQSGTAQQTAPTGTAPVDTAPQPAAASQPTTAAQPETTALPTPSASFVPPIPPVPEPPAATTSTASTASTARVPEAGGATGPSLWDDLTGKTSSTGTAAYGSAPYGTAAPGSAPYGSTPYGSAPYGSAPYGTAPAGTPPYGTPPYGSDGPAPAFDPQRYRTIHRNKQLGAGFISVVAGLALSAGAVAASFVADGSWTSSAFLVGASAALAVIALGIVVAGIRGKEGGWLNFFSILLAATMAWTVVIPVGTDVATFGDPTWQYNATSTRLADESPAGFAMIAGAPVIDLTDVDNAPASSDHTVDVWTAFGEVDLVLPENRTVVVETSTLAGGIEYTGLDDIDRGGVLFYDSRTVAQGSGTGVTTVRVWMLAGQVTINQLALR
jgi:phage shock protein PspC (stress-responsive transcriptional regulator)